MNRRGFAPILIIGIIALVVIAGAVGWYFVAHKNASVPTGVACTQEARQCPDGSYVGRTGPDCAFAECSGVTANSITTSATVNTSGWITYTNQGYEFTIKYPTSWVSVDGGNATSGDILDIAYQTENSVCAHGVGCSYPGEIFMRGITKDSILVPYGTTPSSNFDNFAKQYISAGLDDEATLDASTTIDGHEAIQINRLPNLSGSDKELVPNITELIDYSPGLVIWIEVNYFPENQGYVSQIFNQVLSTFQFIQPTSTIDISSHAYYCAHEPELSADCAP